MWMGMFGVIWQEPHQSQFGSLLNRGQGSGLSFIVELATCGHAVPGSSTLLPRPLSTRPVRDVPTSQHCNFTTRLIISASGCSIISQNPGEITTRDCHWTIINTGLDLTLRMFVRNSHVCGIRIPISSDCDTPLIPTETFPSLPRTPSTVSFLNYQICMDLWLDYIYL